MDCEGEIDIAHDEEEGMNKLSRQDYDLVISDIDMPIMDGLNFYLKAVKKYPSLKGKFLFMTGDEQLHVNRANCEIPPKTVNLTPPILI